MKKITLESVRAGLCTVNKTHKRYQFLKKTVQLFAYYFFLQTIQAQEQAVKVLTIGDRVPNITFTNLINYPTKMAKLTDFKGKLIILDFWATWCGSCVKNFPKLYSLQQEQLGIQVLLINSRSTGDNYAKATAFLNQRSKAYILPSVMEDTMLKALFPHETIPYYVWIKDHKVVGITDAAGITKENIGTALKGELLSLADQKKINYDISRPLFVEGNGGPEPALLFRSILAPHVKGLQATMSTGMDDTGNTSKITFTNSPVIELYQFAYPALATLSAARLVLNVSTLSVFARDSSSDQWQSKYLYNYEAQFPARPLDSARAFVRHDLQKYFGYKITEEDRELNCWVIKDAGAGTNPSSSADKKQETNLFENIGLPVYFKNFPVSALARDLEQVCGEPVIDDTGLNRGVDLTLPAELFRSKSIYDKFEEQGLLLCRELRRLSVIIISKH